MNTVPTIESYREYVPVGRTMFIYRGSSLQPQLWHQCAQNAFTFTMDAMVEFQRQQSLGENRYVIPAIGLWFLSVESYISMHYKIAQLDRKLDEGSADVRSLIETDKIGGKFAATDAYFGGNPSDASDIRKRFDEFTALRNTLFHDLTTVKTPEFHHTNFPSNVENVNEVDIVQAILVCLEVFEYWRQIFEKSDTMPCIWVQANFEKLDTLYKEVLVDTFLDLLTAKGITTTLRLKKPFVPSKASSGHHLIHAIRHSSEAETPSQAPSEPVVALEYWRKAAAARPMEEGKFGLPFYSFASPEDASAQSLLAKP